MGRYTLKPFIRSEVDIQVAQQIKNHQDFMYQTRQDINSLNQKMDEVKQLYKDFTAACIRSEVSVTQKIDSLTTKNIESNVKSLKTLDEYRQTLQREVKLIEGFVNGLDEKYVDWGVYLKSVPTMQSKIDNMENEIKELKRLIDEQVTNLSRLCDSKVKASKEEILSIPSEIPELKRSFQEKFDLMEMDLENGRIRASNNEKQLIVIEKKIEQIYLLIKKLELK